MHLDLTHSGVALTDPDNFRELDVRSPGDLDEIETVRLLDALGAESTEAGHVWLPTRALLERGRPDDADWRAGFDAMLAYADKAGWLRTDASGTQFVRAHVVRGSR